MSLTTNELYVRMCSMCTRVFQLQCSEGKQTSQKFTSTSSEESEEEVRINIDSGHHYRCL